MRPFLYMVQTGIVVGKFGIYNIPLRGLSEGSHTFNYVLDKTYFTNIGDGESDIRRGDVSVELVVKRIGSTFEFGFDLNGVVSVPCDRCLDDLSVEVVAQNKLFVKFGKEYSEESDEIVVIPEDEGEINIAWFLFEFVSLSIPMKRVHAPGKCNRMMSTKLNKHRATSADDEDDIDTMDSDAHNEEVGEMPTDPRWDALKDINVED